jgi:hypothetical protein
MTIDVFLHHYSKIKNLVFLILASLVLSGCAQLLRTEQSKVDSWDALSAESTFGQTFVAKYDGLTAVYFYLSPQEPGEGEIRLHLRSDPQAGEDLAVSLNALAVNAVNAPGYYSFLFPSQVSSNQQYYYALLDVSGKGSVQVGKAGGDTYLNGASYQNGTPEDAQATFQLGYSKRKAILGLSKEVVTWIGILAIGCFLFILPGWGLFCLLWPGWGMLRWPEKLGLSAGLSLALYPLFMLWTGILGLQLGTLYAWLPPLAGLVMVLWKNRSRFRTHKLLCPGEFKPSWADFTFLGLVALVVLTRFWAIRSLDLPMWGDSYQHTMIAQLLMDNGGLFTSWQPYAELNTFTYHFGFHSAVAVFDWITHLDITKAVLWVGQLLNVFAVIALYPLAAKVGRSQWAGVVAVLVAGILSPMPMYYVNWGRYTQLTGQVILPVAVWVIWNILTSNSSSSPDHNPAGKTTRVPRISVFVGCIALGGLALTHYRILILALVFLVIFWVLFTRRNTIRWIFTHTLWLGVGAGLLFLPWFLRVFSGRIVQIFAHQIATSADQAVAADPQLVGVGVISTYLPSIIWLLLLVVLGLGIWRREKDFVMIGLWWFGNILISNPSWFGLPGTGFVTSFTVFIAFYIPAGILLGVSISWLKGLKIPIINLPCLHTRIRKALSIVMAILIIGVGFSETSHRLRDVKPATFSLATRPDVLAAKWILENTPSDARFLVNSFPAFLNSIIAGSDGGWWLPLLSQRDTTLPPFTYGFEKDPWPGYRVAILSLTLDIKAKGIQNPAVLSQLRDRGITYIYVGQLQGLVNSGGALFTVEQLLAEPSFRLAYHQDRVWIFQIQ